ncbi:DUF3397 family protein [Fructilactobacillus myrtifloralis]|uniref:DUF3397 family protein n=1 Tax=Fructilactobacillus myrtifloralis TaxID=2940301 RepID=A0ABY5BQR9_9LACO|nr:DUF3397 family protein [Fructilactobacillus myrtifloralis]USS85531.1 DUF3397 family protein [Fructilactobacillus myrtifloralis]
MNLVQVPQQISSLFQVQLVPFLGLIGALLIISLVRRLLKRRVLPRLRLLDLWPLFAMVVMPTLTIDEHGNTWLPALLCGWCVIGIVVLLGQLFKDGEVLLKHFFIIWWRIGDLYWLLGYVVALFYEIGIRL